MIAMPRIIDFARRVRARITAPSVPFDVFDIHAVNTELAAYSVEPFTEAESDPVRQQLWKIINGQLSLLKSLPTTLIQPTLRVYEVREDLRAKYPLALTPHERREYLAWLLVHGRRELGLTTEGILAAMLTWDASPDRGLEHSYRVQADWQIAVPDALTPQGWPRFIEFIRATYRIGHRWLSRARCDFADHRLPRPDAGVNVVGHYRYASGLQEACVGVVRALEQHRVALSRRDLPVHHPADWRDVERYLDLEPFDTTIYVAAVNTFPREFYRRSGLCLRSGVRRIAYWYWEVDRLPDAWRSDLAWADEVWAPTVFLAEAFRKSVAVPVVPMLPGVMIPEFETKPRSYFDLPDDPRLVLFSFDMGSIMERKNPLGLIAAFEQAFRADDRVHLVIKVSRGAYAPADRARLVEACRRVGATLIDRVLPREDVLALFAAADCYASLHRAEGLGLGMAESMLLSKPVIATAYSGNLDFMDDSTAWLVPARTVPMPPTDPYPPGCVWAEPDVAAAAAHLRTVLVDDREGAQAKAERARIAVGKTLSIDAAGRRMIERITELRR
jgi:glycosyltransferase involved in cell wall biosynthesis